MNTHFYDKVEHLTWVVITYDFFWDQTKKIFIIWLFHFYTHVLVFLFYIKGEIGRLMAELERCQRLELELRRQLKDRERLVDDLQQETEKRVGQIQLEVVNLNSTRQQLEREVGSLRLDLDGSRQELRSEKGRHETEVDSLRGRLKRTEEQLVIIDFWCLEAIL